MEVKFVFVAGALAWRRWRGARGPIRAVAESFAHAWFFTVDRGRCSTKRTRAGSANPVVAEGLLAWIVNLAVHLQARS
jgi:hypothetical protein